MRIKKYFIFDEETKAKQIIKNGFPDNKIDYGEMYLVAKYFRQKYNLKEKELREILIKFCKKQDGEFNPIRDSKNLRKWIKSAMNYNLRIINSITISENDINFIKKIETERDKKIFFAILVLVKSFKKGSTRIGIDYKKSDKYYLRYSNLGDIIKIAGLKNTKDVDIAKIIYNYQEHFTFYMPEKELIRVEWIDKTPQGEITISEFDNLLSLYAILFGEKFERCSICGKEYIKKSNRQKYCEKCVEDIKRKQTRKRVAKHRERSN